MIRGQLTTISRPWIMGILNVTPDSFYAASRTACHEQAIRQRAQVILDEGADVIDIGAYSSRPGADDVSTDEEWRRLDTALAVIRNEHPDALLSVDTFRADIAEKCIRQYAVEIINDISGGTLDANMASTVARHNVTYVLMHMRGTPATMQQLTQYNDNPAAQIAKYLQCKATHLQSNGVNSIIIDPGFGFSKTTQQNFQLLAHLDQFIALGLPVLVGLSRKSMIYRTLGITPEQSLVGTTALNAIALQKGAHLLRVHDVKAAVQTRTLINTINANE